MQKNEKKKNNTEKFIFIPGFISCIRIGKGQQIQI